MVDQKNSIHESEPVEMTPERSRDQKDFKIVDKKSKT